MQKQLLWAVVIIIILGGAYLLWANSSGTASPTGATRQEGTATEENSETSAAQANERSGAGANVDVGATVGTNAPMTASVTYTGSSFSPASVTIKKGGTVTWTNMSSSPMYVASNPHPTHTDYPGFDEKSTNATYSFTFTQAGSWGYHNHKNPSEGGVVNVVQ